MWITLTGVPAWIWYKQKLGLNDMPKKQEISVTIFTLCVTYDIQTWKSKFDKFGWSYLHLLQ